MASKWTYAVLLSAAVAVGCGDRSTDSADDLNKNTAAPEVVGDPVDRPEAQPNTASKVDGSAIDERAGTAGISPNDPQRQPKPAPGIRQSAPNYRPPATSGDTGRSAARTDAAPAPRAPQFRDVSVPAGTAVPLELMTALSSETAAIETPVRARLRQAVVVDGHTVLPAGTVFSGHVTDVDRAGRVKGVARLAFRFTEAEVNGAREDVRTNVLSFQGEETKGEDATKIGAGAVGGAIVGGILGGGSGAAKGAAIGGAAGTGVVLATRGREVTLASGTNLAATLADAFTIRVRN